jgi:hypothetical protein
VSKIWLGDCCQFAPLGSDPGLMLRAMSLVDVFSGERLQIAREVRGLDSRGTMPTHAENSRPF